MDDIIKNWPYVAGGVVLGAVGASVGGCMQLLCMHVLCSMEVTRLRLGAHGRGC